MSDIVIRMPAELKPLAEAVCALVETVTTVRRRLASTGTAVQYGRIETELAERCAAVERAAHQVNLAALDVDAESLSIGGRTYTRVGRHEAPYYTLQGEVRVERSIHREDGVRNARTVDPVSVRAGVVGSRWLPRTARAMAYEMQRGTSREAEGAAREHGRLPYSRSAFEDVGHEVGRLYVEQHDAVEGALMERFVVPAGTRSVSLSADRVSLPMEERRRRPVGRPTKGAAKNPVDRVHRMAWCGTVTLHDANGDAADHPLPPHAWGQRTRDV